MLKRSALVAIAASVLGLAALTPTDASAWYRGGVFTHVGYRFYHPGFYRHPYFGYRAQFFRYGGWAWRPGFCWRHPFYCRARFGAYRFGVAPVVPLAPAVAAPAAVAVPAVPLGRCLIQRRLADGNALFRNLCTNEAAITSNVPESPPLK